jgi:tight adherence protein B
MSVITIFVILLAAVFAIGLYFIEPSDLDKRTRERLAALHRRTAEEIEEGIEKQVTFSRISFVNRYLQRNQVALKLHLMMSQANLQWTVGRFFFYSADMMIAGSVIGRWWLPIGFVGWIPGLLLGSLPLVWVLYKRSARINRLIATLPEAVDLISRALRTGYALPSALVMVADEMSDPLGPEFRRTADELNYGLPFREALLNLVQRFPVNDLHILITAILVQKETGGNLIELLDKIAAVLRARVHLQQKVQVHTAQGRMSAGILISMPFILFVVLNLVHPGYTQPLFESRGGRYVVYGSLVGMVLGVLWIRSIIKIEV